jgi:hypothetical protein
MSSTTLDNSGYFTDTVSEHSTDDASVKSQGPLATDYFVGPARAVNSSGNSAASGDIRSQGTTDYLYNGPRGVNSPSSMHSEPGKYPITIFRVLLVF